MNAQEVAIWKKVIRVIATRSTIRWRRSPRWRSRGSGSPSIPTRRSCARVFATIEERMSHLSQFLEGYSRFAKLPRPRPRP